MPRPLGYRTVMIVRARVPGRFGVAWPGCQRRATLPAVNAHDARGFGSAAPRGYKLRRREGEIPYLFT
jgi:hypothetical protein